MAHTMLLQLLVLRDEAEERWSYPCLLFSSYALAASYMVFLLVTCGIRTTMLWCMRSQGPQNKLDNSNNAELLSPAKEALDWHYIVGYNRKLIQPWKEDTRNTLVMLMCVEKCCAGFLNTMP